MPRVDDYLDLVDNPARQALTVGHPADDALLALLVHMAFSDGAIDEGELDFLSKVLPGREPGQLRAWVEQVGAGGLDISAVAAALPTIEERWKGLRFAARMAWKDGHIQDEERILLLSLARGLGFTAVAVDQVLHEMQGHADHGVDPKLIASSLESMAWDSVQILSEPLGGQIARVAPAGSELVRSIALDQVVVLALYSQGMSAHFMEGTTFILWSDIVTYTRVPTFGAAVQIHTENGRTWTLVDARLRGLSTLIDRLYGTAPRERSAPPGIVKLKGDG
ncbi:MAG: DnaJ-domain-containing protein 1 [Kiritimatiellia bacterium]|jgi:DnaJ-domain-containing protein 1